MGRLGCMPRVLLLVVVLVVGMWVVQLAVVAVAVGAREVAGAAVAVSMAVATGVRLRCCWGREDIPASLHHAGQQAHWGSANDCILPLQGGTQGVRGGQHGQVPSPPTASLEGSQVVVGIHHALPHIALHWGEEEGLPGQALKGVTGVVGQQLAQAAQGGGGQGARGRGASSSSAATTAATTATATATATTAAGGGRGIPGGHSARHLHHVHAHPGGAVLHASHHSGALAAQGAGVQQGEGEGAVGAQHSLCARQHAPQLPPGAAGNERCLCQRPIAVRQQGCPQAGVEVDGQAISGQAGLVGGQLRVVPLWRGHAREAQLQLVWGHPQQPSSSRQGLWVGGHCQAARASLGGSSSSSRGSSSRASAHWQLHAKVPGAREGRGSSWHCASASAGGGGGGQGAPLHATQPHCPTGLWHALIGHPAQQQDGSQHAGNGGLQGGRDAQGCHGQANAHALLPHSASAEGLCKGRGGHCGPRARGAAAASRAQVGCCSREAATAAAAGEGGGGPEGRAGAPASPCWGCGRGCGLRALPGAKGRAGSWAILGQVRVVTGVVTGQAQGAPGKGVWQQGPRAQQGIKDAEVAVHCLWGWGWGWGSSALLPGRGGALPPPPPPPPTTTQVGAGGGREVGRGGIPSCCSSSSRGGSPSCSSSSARPAPSSCSSCCLLGAAGSACARAGLCEGSGGGAAGHAPGLHEGSSDQRALHGAPPHLQLQGDPAGVAGGGSAASGAVPHAAKGIQQGEHVGQQVLHGRAPPPQGSPCAVREGVGHAAGGGCAGGCSDRGGGEASRGCTDAGRGSAALDAPDHIHQVGSVSGVEVVGGGGCVRSVRGVPAGQRPHPSGCSVHCAHMGGSCQQLCHDRRAARCAQRCVQGLRAQRVHARGQAQRDSARHCGKVEHCSLAALALAAGALALDEQHLGQPLAHSCLHGSCSGGKQVGGQGEGSWAAASSSAGARWARAGAKGLPPSIALRLSVVAPHDSGVVD